MDTVALINVNVEWRGQGGFKSVEMNKVNSVLLTFFRSCQFCLSVGHLDL